MHERRRSPRLSERWQMTYRVMDIQGWRPPVREETLNISSGGLCFFSSERLPPNTLISFELTSDHHDSSLVGMAQVVWCRPSRNGFENGAAFCWHEWGGNAAAQLIHEYVMANASAGSPPMDTPRRMPAMNG